MIFKFGKIQIIGRCINQCLPIWCSNYLAQAHVSRAAHKAKGREEATLPREECWTWILGRRCPIHSQVEQREKRAALSAGRRLGRDQRIWCWSPGGRESGLLQTCPICSSLRAKARRSAASSHWQVWPAAPREDLRGEGLAQVQTLLPPSQTGPSDRSLWNLSWNPL